MTEVGNCTDSKMLCLHGKPAVSSTTENGTFWSCGEPSTCFVCSEEEKQLYDKAIKAFLATKQDRPKCCGIVPDAQAADIERYYANYYKFRVYTGTRPHKQWNPYKPLGGFVSAADAERHYAKFRVYTGKEQHEWWSGHKKHIGRPFFTCGKTDDKWDPQRCGYFEWGDKNIITKPLCEHGKVCIVDGRPGERHFFKCKYKGDSCHCFKWCDPANEEEAKRKETSPGLDIK